MSDRAKFVIATLEKIMKIIMEDLPKNKRTKKYKTVKNHLCSLVLSITDEEIATHRQTALLNCVEKYGWKLDPNFQII